MSKIKSLLFLSQTADHHSNRTSVIPKSKMLSQAVDRRRDIVGQDLLTPFYAPPDRKTSAQIIREARNAINISDTGMGVQRMGVRTVQTKRPFTPRERERTLFSNSAGTTRGERPPSSFT